MEFIKKKWQIIVIVILVLFGMNKCTSSCTNANKFEESNKTHIEYVHKTDSTIKVLNDSINLLNVKLQIYNERVAGLNQALSIQDEANKRISEAKKNISVQVRQK